MSFATEYSEPQRTDYPLGSRTISPDGVIWQLNGTQTKKYWVRTQFTEKQATSGIKKWDISGYLAWGELAPAYLGNVSFLSDQTKDSSGALRWPEQAINVQTDYIMFQFGKYRPPLGEGRRFKGEGAFQNAKDAKNSKTPGYFKYKNSSQLETIDDSPIGEVGPIILPMPQDFQDIMEQNWQGKQFSRVGMTALSGLAGQNFSDITDAGSDVRGNLKSLGGALTASGMNKIPGVGGNLTLSDVTGSVWGSVLNPNVETLYESPQQREFSMTYKLVPRNKEEAKIIKQIVQRFRYAAAPAWGDKGVGGGFSMTNRGTDNGKGKVGDFKGKGNLKDGTPAENFITVPWLCQFVFQTGGSQNQNLPIIKPCAIKKVGVNYTPDGTYATYSDGSMLSTEITLTFLETKLIFKQDILEGY